VDDGGEERPAPPGRLGQGRAEPAAHARDALPRKPDGRGDGARTGLEPRRGDEHEPPHGGWVTGGERRGEGAAQGMPDEVERPARGPLERGRERIGDRRELEAGAHRGGGAEPRDVHGEHAARPRQLVHDPPPDRAARPHAVHERERRPVARRVDLERADATSRSTRRRVRRGRWRASGPAP